MERIRLVVSDLDGTLLNPQKQIAPGLLPLLRQLEQRGVGFTFITGRPPYAVQRFAEAVELQAPMVTCNGAILCGADGAVLARRSFALAPLQAVLEEAAALGLTVLVYTGDVEYALAETDWTRRRAADGRALPIKRFTAAEWSHGTADKVNIMETPQAKGRFGPLQSALLALKEQYALTVYEEGGCEIVAHGMNKEVGLLELCGLLAVPPQQVLAIGDNGNDVEMLRAAGVGAAVANATAPARQSADYVCREAYTHGVMEAIQRFVLEEDAT